MRERRKSTRRRHLLPLYLAAKERTGAAADLYCPKCPGRCASRQEEGSSRGPEAADPCSSMTSTNSAAEGTVRFGQEGREYEIDLNAEHAQQMRDALAAYVRAARRVSSSSRRAALGGRRESASTLNTTEVRKWAKAQGIKVKDRGRVPAELSVKFKAATGQ